MPRWHLARSALVIVWYATSRTRSERNDHWSSPTSMISSSTSSARPPSTSAPRAIWRPISRRPSIGPRWPITEAFWSTARAIGPRSSSRAATRPRSVSGRPSAPSATTEAPAAPSSRLTSSSRKNGFPPLRSIRSSATCGSTASPTRCSSRSWAAARPSASTCTIIVLWRPGRGVHRSSSAGRAVARTTTGRWPSVANRSSTRASTASSAQCRSDSSSTSGWRLVRWST